MPRARPPRVAATDRAFRALARLEPELVLELLRVARPGFMPEFSVDADGVEDPKLDLPPPLEADLVARAGDEILHVEGQGYGDRTFEERLFRYHLVLVVRHPERRVRTVALWLARPGSARRLGRIEHGGVTIDVETVVLAELSAEALLEHPATACFAVGASAGPMSDRELCRRVAEALRAQNAPWQRLLLCLALANARRRYHAMIDAMNAAQLEIPIIEDLVQIGREEGVQIGREEGVQIGREEGVQIGREEGVQVGLRLGIFDLLTSRGLEVGEAHRRRIEHEHDVHVLTRLLRRAAAAESAEAIFEE